MPVRDLNGCRVLLTGASAGIGQELAQALAAYPVKLVLVARQAEPLNKLAAELRTKDRDVVTVIGDITDPAVRHAAVQQAEAAFGGLDVLINNAGVGAIGPFAEGDEARLRRVMEVNFFAAVELIRSALKTLQQGRQPCIVNVSSILGHRGIPFYTEYCASKFALQGFSESLRAELAPLGIGLLIVSPGTTDTKFFEHLVGQKGTVPWSEKRGVRPEVVARAIVKALRSARNEITPSWRGWLLTILQRLCPRGVDWMMARLAKQESKGQ